ncbi:GTP pyrophosphokinase family protein [Glutamicibacter creatinolyticus]|uniref:GTP pyrophosphokinase YwaC n=2 Tax=Micrococcaceae TaxID=1268 RepID=A0A5B7WUQ5_9MICC|nr:MULTISPECIES: GTP pyrophosphokinase family protein [Glutamicibacter]QCY47846.1 GTP pyrophosphokinase YwaC [Glutamicibacter creatinolyticus]TLK51251.1 GTP pyrophosphokinase family protein [Glutamicibacter sp. V16R2B1]
MLDFAQSLRQKLPRFMMEYRFGVDEMLTKVSILREEFIHLHQYNPIEHVTSRVKSPEGILEKVVRRGCAPTLEEIRRNITDIAGIRITCSFLKDTYHVLDMITSQHDVRVLAIKDYIKNPKPNGYKSLHAIVELPVYLSEGPVPVIVEVQIRTIAQDFWASLEHKIFYKYEGEVPEHLLDNLTAAANAAEHLDRHMEHLYDEVHGEAAGPAAGTPDPSADQRLWEQLWQLAQQNDLIQGTTRDLRTDAGDAAG